MKILVINGPNLNMLGVREPDKYGSENYEALLEKIRRHAEELSAGGSSACEQGTGGCGGGCGNEKAAGSAVECEFYQSNHEGDLVDRIQQAYYDKVDGIIINPGAYTHTSIALLDAVNAVKIPTAEVHISDVRSREDFRQVSYIRAACCFTVMGHGLDGYLEAMDYLYEHLQ